MEASGPEAFYSALQARPHSPINLGEALAVVQTPAGQPDVQLRLPDDADAAQLLEVADDGAPYPAPPELLRNAGVVHSAAAKVLQYQDRAADGKPPVVTYDAKLMHTKWQFPPNQMGSCAVGEPTVSPSMPETEWDASIRQEMQRQTGPGPVRLVLFVHGYNTLPAEANDTAQRLLQPVGPKGGLGIQAVVSFTWDSAGRTMSYLHEEFMAEADSLSDHLAALIRRLLHIKLDHGKRWQLIILAHSMGNRPATAALGKVYKDERAALLLNTADAPMLVVNAAADIDASTYSQTMQPIMSLLGKTARALVLASSHDIPLIMSYLVHGRAAQANGKEQRVGLLIEGLDEGWRGALKVPSSPLGRLRNAFGGLLGHGGPHAKVPQLDVIDCSVASQAEIAANGNGHGYFVHSEAVRAKIAAAMTTPDTAQRLQTYNKEGIARLMIAPEGSPRPFIVFDGPMYQIKQVKGASGSQH